MCDSIVAASGFDLCLKYAQNVVRENNGDNMFAGVHQLKLAQHPQNQTDPFINGLNLYFGDIHVHV